MMEDMEERRLCSVTGVALTVNTASADCKEGSPISVTLTPTCTTGDTVAYYAVSWDSSTALSNPEYFYPLTGGAVTISHTFIDAGVGTTYDQGNYHTASGTSTTFPVFVQAISNGQGSPPWDSYSGQVSGIQVFDVPPTITATLSKSDYWSDEEIVLDIHVDDPGQSDSIGKFFIDWGDGSDLDGDNQPGGWVLAADIPRPAGDYELQHLKGDQRVDVVNNTVTIQGKQLHDQLIDDIILTGQLERYASIYSAYKLEVVDLSDSSMTNSADATYQLYYHGETAVPEIENKDIEFDFSQSEMISKGFGVTGAAPSYQFDPQWHVWVLTDAAGQASLHFGSSAGTTLNNTDTKSLACHAWMYDMANFDHTAWLNLGNE
jgi:hypothetical protein